VVVMKNSIFWDIMQCNPLTVNRHFGGTCCFHLQGQRISQARKQALPATCFMLVSCLAYSFTLKMEVTCPSEVSVDFQQTAWHYITKDRTFQVFNEFPKCFHTNARLAP
jgi:hypothetical protein